MSEEKDTPAADLAPPQPVASAQTLQLAAQNFHAGRLAKAEKLCLQALETDPGNAAASHLLSSIVVRLCRQPTTRFYSQLGQDEFVYKNYFRGKRDGVFVDVGAYDGKKFSNTLFFEKFLGWNGVCIEPLPAAFRKLSALRKARCFNCCVSDYEGESDFLDVDVAVDEKMLSGLVENYDPRHTARINSVLQSRNLIKSPVTTLPALLRQCEIKQVDYCSIDTEGSELKILQSLDFREFGISVISIENNYGDDRIRRIMEKNSYALAHVFDGYDELYVNAGLQSLPRTTVICAVWHADPHRHRMLQQHARNLRGQTRPVERIYVFDNGDSPPADLDGTALIARDKLTIYQAWNLALAAVTTPYVMNLNLDDRLAPDAVAEMERALDDGADLVGGDWKICFSEEETNTPAPSHPADLLPFLPDWPPRAGTLTRLGSGTGERGTLGPACLWRTSLHGELGRYPWRFGDDTLVRTISDTIWWRMLNMAEKKIARLPRVIGNYYSHPHEQCEFRYPTAPEVKRLMQVGVNNE
jgi:FkbM family methyltransferase